MSPCDIRLHMVPTGRGKREVPEGMHALSGALSIRIKGKLSQLPNILVHVAKERE